MVQLTHLSISETLKIEKRHAGSPESWRGGAPLGPRTETPMRVQAVSESNQTAFD